MMLWNRTRVAGFAMAAVLAVGGGLGCGGGGSPGGEAGAPGAGGTAIAKADAAVVTYYYLPG
ncbi:MAG TPA: hypothetical protein VLT84_01175 [Acidobacteriota bacterium]|nr:hypothetical protein [Acidobacteriota bacterium]